MDFPPLDLKKVLNPYKGVCPEILYLQTLWTKKKKHVLVQSHEVTQSTAAVRNNEVKAVFLWPSLVTHRAQFVQRGETIRSLRSKHVRKYLDNCEDNSKQI